MIVTHKIFKYNFIDFAPQAAFVLAQVQNAQMFNYQEDKIAAKGLRYKSKEGDSLQGKPYARERHFKVALQLDPGL